MYCKECGTQYSHEDKFCQNCGTELHQEVVSELNTSVPIQSKGEKTQDGTVYIVLGWIFFGLSLLIIPILFGAGSVVMGYLVRKKGRETHGTVMMILGVAGAVLGVLIGAAVGSGL